MSRFCKACGDPFTPAAVGQRTCSFRCARDLVPRVLDDEDDDGPRVVSAMPEVQTVPVERESPAQARAKRLTSLRASHEARLELYRAMARSRLN
jgi:hypothetical protein